MALLGARLKKLFKNPANDKKVAYAIAQDESYDKVIVIDLGQGQKVRLVPSSLYDEDENYDDLIEKQEASR